MHGAALEWVAWHARRDPSTVLDLGGRNVNGSPQPLFRSAQFTTLDIRPGADIEADAADWVPTGTWDMVLCLETFEHAERWRDICVTAFEACKPGGWFIVTTAAPGRPVHSTEGSLVLPEGEYYGNVEPDDLRAALESAGFVDIAISHKADDVRSAARRP